jgi:hypothetical protein
METLMNGTYFIVCGWDDPIISDIIEVLLLETLFLVCHVSFY